jgi:hypothetical protein
MATTSDGAGYWLVGSNGEIYAFGDAANLGNGIQLAAAPIVCMAATADGGGYWLVGSNGGIYAFGDAPSLGSKAGVKLPAPIVGMATL